MPCRAFLSIAQSAARPYLGGWRAKNAQITAGPSGSRSEGPNMRGARR